MTRPLQHESFLDFPRDAVLVVTGAASGIGREVAVAAAAVGLSTSAWDVDGDRIGQLAEELRGTDVPALGLRVDVADGPAVADALAQTTEELGAVAYVVNNAGPSSFSTIAFADALAVAVGSVRLVTEAWLAQPGSRGGAVVNISSIAGAITGGGAADWYATAKSAIAGYTRYLAVNRPNGIRANAVAPGFTETPRTAALLSSDAGRDAVARTPMKRAASAAEIAGPVLFLLSPAASYVNGVLLPVDGGAVVAL